MGTETGESNAVPEVIHQLVEKINKHCENISVAKDKSRAPIGSRDAGHAAYHSQQEECSRLIDLCNDLIKRLSDGSLNPRPSKYEDIKSNLAVVEEHLEGLSKQRKLEIWRVRMGIKQCYGRLVDAISQREGTDNTVPQHVQQPVDNIRKHCKKIRVAKEEYSRLMNLCDDLIKRLSDSSLALRPYEYEDIKSNLAVVEKRMEGWSKCEYPEMMRESVGIGLGITECFEQLFAVIPQREGTDVGSFAVSTGDAHDDAGWLADEPLDGEFVREGDRPLELGKHCEPLVGHWRGGGGKVNKVALKTLGPSEELKGVRKRLDELRGLEKWHHRNVLPFRVTDIGSYLHIMSPWQENGDLLAYVENSPEPKKNELLRGAANGLSVLHSRSIVHGNVKCRNVLISRTGEPLICDFAIVNIVEKKGTATGTELPRDVIRYGAIELIEGSNVAATMKSDTYSFAMLILECITEKVPFSGLSRDSTVLHARAHKRQTPPRPDVHNPKGSVSDGLWDLMRRCWSENHEDRPTMNHVHMYFVDH